MSDLLESIMSAAKPSLEKIMEELPKQFLDQAEETVGSLEGPVRVKVEGHLKKAAEFKWKAINQDDTELRRQYAEAAGDEIARAETVLISEAAAVSLEQAESLMAGFKSVMSTVGSVAKSIISTIVGGAISGAIKGLTGGAAPDLGSIFPGA